MRFRQVGTLAIALCSVPGVGFAQIPGEKRQVEIDGHAMHFVGAGRGTPTVVLEAGGGWSLNQWNQVQPALAAFTRVVAYDRPSLGASAPCPKPETAQRVAQELHDALQAAGLPPPYVLVAHSMGGPYARVFTKLFSKEVVGLVLVDPAPEHFYARVRAELPELAAAIDQAPDAPQGAARAAVEATLVQAAGADPLPPIPTVLITRGKWGDAPPALSRIWTEEHQLWVERTPTARRVVAERSGHDIPREQPELIVEAVRDVIARSKGGLR